jgi:hypothetical protein
MFRVCSLMAKQECLSSGWRLDGRRMPVLDHLFIMCDVGAPEATALSQLGLDEMASNTHPGQGTACRRFSLAEQYLELLWVSDEDKARSDGVRPTQLWERWDRRRTGACPFGLVFRADAPEASAPPFRTWTYAPRYLPPGRGIEVACDAPIDGPAFFFLPFVTSSRGRSPARVGAYTASTVTHVGVGVPGAFPESDALRWARGMGLLSFTRSDAFEVTLALDNAQTGRRADVRPDLPLVFRW